MRNTTTFLALTALTLSGLGCVDVEGAFDKLTGGDADGDVHVTFEGCSFTETIDDAETKHAIELWFLVNGDDPQSVSYSTPYADGVNKNPSPGACNGFIYGEDWDSCYKGYPSSDWIAPSEAPWTGSVTPSAEGDCASIAGAIYISTEGSAATDFTAAYEAADTGE